MLVLTRRQGESVTIGSDVTVTVTRTRSGHVRLGIEAPPELRIVRGELPARESGDRGQESHAASRPLPPAA